MSSGLAFSCCTETQSRQDQGKVHRRLQTSRPLRRRQGQGGQAFTSGQQLDSCLVQHFKVSEAKVRTGGGS